MKLKHPEYLVTEKSRKTRIIYGWVEQVCIGLKPFNFVEDSIIRKYSILDNISTVTLKKYMDLLVLSVEEKISLILPEKFSLIIDGWTKGSTYFFGIFASFLHNGNLKTVLLSFSPLLVETDLTAQNYFNAIEPALEIQ